MKRKAFFLIVLFMSMTVLSGCWSRKELTDLAFVIAVGLDKTKDGRYMATFQVVNPGNVAGATQRGGGSGGVPITLYKATGDNLVEASRKGSQKISRLIYYAHTNLIVIGEEMAKEGIGPLFDAMERNPQFRTTAIVVIARHRTAEEMLKILTPIDKLPANQMIKTLQFTEKTWGQNISVHVGEVINDLTSEGKEPVISGFRLVGGVQEGERQTNVQESEPDARLSADDLAILKDGKLVGWISGKAARGVLWGLDKIEQTVITIDWKHKQEAIAYKVVRAKTSVSADMKKGKPVVSVHIGAEGDVGEALVPLDFSDPQEIFALEKKIQKEIRQEIIKAIERAQQEKSDIFGFGEALHRSDPQEWKKIKADWNDTYFPQLEVKVSVDASIRRTGLRNKPYMFGR
ncbi:Ger(x)C family spore germination protein [Thermaerobacillus caldiproteolyticus]|uniref:Ger(x)C family spore germination protein n=1 Tax=Thermaerobacillus caldiproteolyticus TaxID=247480 RepID=UPI00227771E0|nr:Ger(x)C family spore germination protein [Anoxybacillus caldiproteolyticus]